MTFLVRLEVCLADRAYTRNRLGSKLGVTAQAYRDLAEQVAARGFSNLYVTWVRHNIGCRSIGIVRRLGREEVGIGTIGTVDRVGLGVPGFCTGGYPNDASPD